MLSPLTNSKWQGVRNISAQTSHCAMMEPKSIPLQSVKNEEADEHFVIILSDANFDRYGIRPVRFTEALQRDEEVNAFAIFIGSLGDQAERYVRVSVWRPVGRLGQLDRSCRTNLSDLSEMPVI